MERPRVVAVGQRINGRVERTVAEIGQGHVFEHGAQVGANRNPRPLQHHKVIGVVQGVGPLAADVGQGPFGGADDVGHGDLGGGPVQPVAAIGASHAAHDVAALEIGEDVFQELRGNVLGFRDGLAGERAWSRAIRGVGACEFDGSPHRVVDLRCNPHRLPFAYVSAASLAQGAKGLPKEHLFVALEPAPARVGDGTGLEEQAELGAGKGCLLVGVHPAPLDLFVRCGGARGVVTTILTHGHGVIFARSSLGAWPVGRANGR